MIPSTSSAVAISDVAIGRRMKGAEDVHVRGGLGSPCASAAEVRRMRDDAIPWRRDAELEPWPSITTVSPGWHAGPDGGEVILPHVDRPADARRGGVVLDDVRERSFGPWFTAMADRASALRRVCSVRRTFSN